MAVSVLYNSLNPIPNDGHNALLPADRISIVGNFSCDDTTGTIGEASPCYLIEGPFPNPADDPEFNLLEGLESYIPKVNFNEQFDYQLDFLSQKYQGQTELSSIADIFTARGVLSKLLAVPVDFQPRDRNNRAPAKVKWRFIIQKVRDVIFMIEGDTDGPQDNWELGERRPNTYSGYRFEQRMTSHIQGSRISIEEPVNRLKREYSVAQSKLIKGNSNIRLWYTAEIDGIGNDGNHVELKTMAASQVERGNIKFPNKCRSIWAQSMLFGIKRIICGVKGNRQNRKEFVVEKILDIPIDQLAARIGNDQHLMLNTLYHILQKIQQTLRNGDAAYLEKHEFSDRVEIRMISKDFNSVNFLRKPAFLEKYGIYM